MKLEEAQKIVFEAKPVFKKLYETYKNKNWSEYINDNFPTSPTNELSLELKNTFHSVVEKLLGKEKAKLATESLNQTGFVDTADHHGLLCHPFFFNFDLAKVSKSVKNRPSTQIVLTVGGISPTNSSFPRSFFFHDKSLNLQKVHLTSLKGRRRSLYGLPKTESFTKIKDQIWGFNIPKPSKDRFVWLCEKWNRNEQIQKANRFCEQLTTMNDIWWDEIFGNSRGNLLYLEVEELIKELIISKHLSKQTKIWQILFDEETRKKYISSYEKITGAHETQTKKGTHLFWYIDEKENTRKQLWISENSLISEDIKINIPLKEEILKEKLLDYSLLPSMALCYSILSFYYDLSLGGGFSQIQYLGDMKKAWLNVFREDEEKVSKIRTDIFSGESGIIGISDRKNTQLATLADIFLYSKHSEDANKMVEIALSNTSIEQSLNAMMYEFLEIVTGSYQNIENMPEIHKTINV